MKGFVPVSKADLYEMAENAISQINNAYPVVIRGLMNEALKKDKKRASERRLFGLLKPHARLLNENSTFEEFKKAATILIDNDWYHNPFVRIERKYERVIAYYDDFRDMALNDYAGEPILISLEDFQTLSRPENNYFCYLKWWDLT